MQRIDFWTLLPMVQAHIAEKYAAALNDKDKLPQLRAYIEKFIRDNEYAVEGYSLAGLVERVYDEMVEFSIITPFMKRDDIEEVNINSAGDVVIIFTNGGVRKLKNGFHSPQHATDVIKRMLQKSGMIIDNATPIAQGHLENNIRITALMNPIVDKEIGIAASIRMLHPQSVTQENLIEEESLTPEMFDFLRFCIRYGGSMVVAGATASGKTTLLNCLLQTYPNDMRIFTIESGSRELTLIKELNGRVINNVVHTLSRPSENPANDITQEDLVVAAMRFRPNLICVGEMRDKEAYAAVEASITGHTIVSTVHASSAEAAHRRIALLSQKRMPLKYEISMLQSAQAFPIVVSTHKLDDNSRKIMDISECTINPDGSLAYRCLYRYNIVKNEFVNGKCVVEGYFSHENEISENLTKQLMKNGAPQSEIMKFKKEVIPA